jgi:hypothetical protein
LQNLIADNLFQEAAHSMLSQQMLLEITFVDGNVRMYFHSRDSEFLQPTVTLTPLCNTRGGHLHMPMVAGIISCWNVLILQMRFTQLQV